MPTTTKGARGKKTRPRVLPHQRWLYAMADVVPVSDDHRKRLEHALAVFVRSKGRRMQASTQVKGRVVVLTTRGRVPSKALYRRYTSGHFPIVVAYKQKGK